MDVNIDTMKKRLRRYYDHYLPGQKTDGDVSTHVAMFTDGKAGGFDAMWAKLEAKHGKESDVPATSTIELAADEKIYYARMNDYYQFYGHARTDADLKTAILKFRGQSGGLDKMMQKLVQKYGPEPSAADLAKWRATQAARGSDTGSAAGRAAGATAAGGADAAAAAAAAAALMVDPEAPRLQFDAMLEAPAAKLRRYYNTHAPTKTTEDIQETLKRNETNPTGLWLKLNEKYGAMPLPPPGYAHAWNRLRLFFNSYAPDTKNSQIDWMLAEAYSTPTGVGEMWQDLKARFGPEPLDPAIERAMRGPNFLTARSIGDPPTAALTVAAREDESSWFRRSRATMGANSAGVGGSNSPRGAQQSGNSAEGTQPEIVRLILQFTGIDAYFLEDLPIDKRRRIADALEQQVALNAQMQARNVALVDYKGSEAEFELAAQAGNEHALFGAAASIVNRALKGGFNVKLLREVYMRECRASALHVHAIGARVVKAGAKGAGSTTRAVTDPAAVLRDSANPPAAPKLNMSDAEANAIRVADEVARMTEAQRTQHSWRRALEERLQGKAGTSLSYKRNAEEFRSFMSNIWSDTSRAFGAEPVPAGAGGGGEKSKKPPRTENPIPPK